VTAMGGRLWIEDKPAGGSQFVTALPEAHDA
jgi:signal transduction histidine kinase